MTTARKTIVLISTGGTIEKTYDELAGVLANRVSVLDVMLASLDLKGIRIERIALMNKDSLDMSDADHDLVAANVLAQVQREEVDGIVITHGTDRLATTGERILARLRQEDAVKVPVVLIGAIRPYALRSTDALQNLTEAFMAVQLLQPGVYCVMHNMVLAFPGVVKDRKLGTFVKQR
ncbi:MAG: asparaginase domain-containing protein [Phycisphaerales bacterium]